MNYENSLVFMSIFKQTPFTINELKILVATAAWRYKEHSIKKRNGSGIRTISQPTLEVKYIQRLVMGYIKEKLLIHNSAMAYLKNKSIKDHVVPHVKSNFLLKIDFKDFFPSIQDHALRHFLLKDGSFSEEDIFVICNVLFKKSKNKILTLSIGAPSSPFVSNCVMFEFDTMLTEFCLENNLIYTRYADDLAISSLCPSMLYKVENEIESIINRLDYLNLRINKLKTLNVSKKNNRTLVGLVLSNDGVVSIGRDKKRKIRAAINYFVNGKLNREEISKLRGQLAFINSIDCDFVSSLCEKNGLSSFREIQ